MIERIKGCYRLICDVCGEAADERLDDFQDAVDFKKTSDWKSVSYGGVWQDMCPDCKE